MVPLQSTVEEHRAEAQLLTALEGSQVQLACDITAPGPGDFPVRIRWFKDSGPNPVYSVEVNPKTGSLSQIRQSAQLTSLQGRAYFSVIQSPAVLSVDRLRYSDNGTYVCAVDFKKDWTRRLTTHLVVIVPPKQPLILDENGTAIENMTRPYLEGDDLTLTCDVYDGKPEPMVTWWRGAELLQQVLSRTPNGNPRATLFRLKLTREDYLAKLTCTAANSNVTEPVSTSITVNMYLQPVSVEIKGPRGPLSADLSAQVICQVNGSRPGASVHWFLGPYQLNDTETHVMSPNTTLGVLHFVPSNMDHAARLRCVATNSVPSPRNLVLEDSWNLDVHYKPLVHLRLGSGLNPASIHEGIDIYFECSVRANPGVSEVTWRFNGRELHTDGSRGVIVSNQSLALRSVGRSNSGFYACSAANSEGESESSQLKLRVLHAPLCRSPKRQHSHAVAKHETVEVHCDMEADPSDVTFTWTFHQTHRNFQLAPNASSSTLGANHARSVLPYTPKVDSDYGTLYCLASNAVGDSVEPCIFQIIPVGPPATPFNCTVEEVTSEGVHVTCQRSGPAQQQTFLLELHDGQSPAIATNFTSGQASFRVHSLRPATRYRVVLYGVNANGRSEPVHMTVVTLPLERTLASQGENAEAAWALGSTTLWAAVLSAAAAFLIVFIALTLGKFRRKVLFNRGKCPLRLSIV
ncbi:hemicentin-1 [Ixodes scapularis]|uniref:hemicentin-1 n=1 Tax=Ixodes scapularis TaxID=6945 RepID=UPI001AD65C07|nr:hemicentin-1 [Ixodes scapularis]